MKFTVVDREKGDGNSLPDMIDRWTKRVESGKMDLPVDGLVICYDDTDYASTGSVTGHHATRAGYAFKWQDEAVESKLRYIEWSCAVSTISPVAVFEPVQIEGTTVSRASLCNLSEIERLGVGKECTLEVIKANKIIPKCIAVKDAIGEVEIPTECPVCKAATRIHTSNSGTKTLHCTNPDCTAKNVQKFSRFVSKNAMDIEGLSAATLEKFIGNGWSKNFGDLYTLEKYKDEIISTEGFGTKSYERLQESIEKSRHTTLAKLISSFGINTIGRHAGRELDRYFHGSWEAFEHAINEGFDFTQLSDFGITMHNNIYQWYKDPEEEKLWRPLIDKIILEKENADMAINTNNPFYGKTVVATGKLENYTRDGIQMKLLELGAKPGSSVSKNTDYLIVGEKAGSKLTKANDLGVKTLTEQEFELMIAG